MYKVVLEEIKKLVQKARFLAVTVDEVTAVDIVLYLSVHYYVVQDWVRIPLLVSLEYTMTTDLEENDKAEVSFPSFSFFATCASLCFTFFQVAFFQVELAMVYFRFCWGFGLMCNFLYYRLALHFCWTPTPCSACVVYSLFWMSWTTW